MISAPARIASIVARADPLEVPPISPDDVGHLPPLPGQLGEIRRLVLLALAAEKVAVLVGDEGPLARAVRDLERQRRESNHERG